FRFAGAVGDALVWERAGPPPASCATLRVTRTVVESNRGPSGPRHKLTVDVTPADAGRPWRVLDRGGLAAAPRGIDGTGRAKRFPCRFGPEPFIPAGGSTTFMLGYLDGLTGPIVDVRLHADWLAGTEYEWSANPGPAR